MTWREQHADKKPKMHVHAASEGQTELNIADQTRQPVVMLSVDFLLKAKLIKVNVVVVKPDDSVDQTVSLLHL